MELTNAPHLDDIEAQIVDTLIGWKNRTDDLARHTAAARAAVAQAKALEIWSGRYGSFKAWLDGECGISEQWAYALISDTRTILQIEEAAGASKELQELTEPKNAEALRALPEKAFRKLRTISPKKAAKAALRAIKKSGGKPSARDVAAEVLIETGEVPKALTPLEAMDREWIKMVANMPKDGYTPSETYKRLRKVVEQSCSEKP